MHCIHILSILLAVVSIAGPSSALAVSDSKLTDQQLRQRGNEYLLNNGNPDSAIACWQAILRRPHDNSPQQRQQLAMAHNNMGYVYMFYRYDYTLAIKHLLEAQQLAPQSDATILLNLGMATNFYAQCFPTDENISNSCTFLTASLRKAIQQDKHTIAYSAFANLWTFGFTPFALSTASEAMALFAKIKPQRDNNEWRYAACLWHAAQSMQQGHPQEALEWLRRQLRCVNAENPQRDSCYTYCLMAQVLAAINCPPRDIIAYADKVRDMALRHGMKDYEKDAAQMLADCYFRCGDTITARRYELEYFKRRDSLLLRSGLAKVQTGYLSHHLDLASRQVEELQQKRRVQTAVLITSLCGIGVAAVLVVLLFLQNRKLRRRNRMLYRNNVDMLEREERQNAIVAANQSGGDADKIQTKYQGSTLTDDEKQRLKQLIAYVMAQPQYICSPHFTMEQLAAQCGTNYKNVSQVVNECFGCSFSILLSEYRVKEACRRINDTEHYGHFTIEAISQSVGFKARSGFFRAFKRVTGLSPSEYVSLAHERSAY